MRAGAFRLVARGALVVLCLGAGSFLTACGESTASTGQSTAQTSTPTATPLATATIALPSPTATAGMGSDPCTQPSAETASYLSANHIPTPAKSGFITSGEGAADGVQQSFDFQDAKGCAQGITPAQITAFYTAQMPANGWTVSTKQPPCQGSPCWIQTLSATQSIGVTLQHVATASSGATTFTLHIVSLIVSN